MNTTSRRTFLRSATSACAALGVGDLAFLSPSSSTAGAVRFHAGIEPLVRLLEETPRERVLETFAARIRAGLGYDDVLAAVHLAGIRNIPPRPDSGWKFHAVLVIHSAHLAASELTGTDRWIPVFFALEFFKRQQAYDERESDWTMGAVEESALPEAGAARDAFTQAMEAWDDEAADAATAALVRGVEPKQVFEAFARYGVRDFRFIGHKTIYTANCWRAVEYLGWQYAEPLLRSLTYSLLNHHDEPNPAESALEADAPWRHNLELAESIRTGWDSGRSSASATTKLLDTLRSGPWKRASQQVVEFLNDGVSPAAIQDALFLAAAELLIRQPGIVSLHGMTSTNALAYLYRTSTVDRTRRLLLLQNAACLVQFRDYLREIGPWGEDRIDALQPAPLETGGVAAVDEIFAVLADDPVEASRMALAFLQAEGNRPEDFIRAARSLSTLKCRNGHDYKFSSAVLEDYARISPPWRDRYLAASVHYLRSNRAPDNELVEQTRLAFAN
jgi:hypothetical protein